MCRFGESNIDGFNMISLMLPGVAVTYYGEEIGMVNTEVSWEDTVDPAGINCGEDHFNVSIYEYFISIEYLSPEESF